MRKDESKAGPETRSHCGRNYARGLRGRRNNEASAPPTAASTTAIIIPNKNVIASPDGSEASCGCRLESQESDALTPTVCAIRVRTSMYSCCAWKTKIRIVIITALMAKATTPAAPPRRDPRAAGRTNSTFTAVEKNSQCPSQHDAEQWDHPNKNAKHAGLERGTNGNASVHRASGRMAARAGDEASLVSTKLSGENSSGAGFKPAATPASGIATCTWI